jgi:hypothetical protein
MNRAEYEIGDKVTYWNGDKFHSSHVTNLNLNPITNTVEYRLFYRVAGTESNKRSRVYVTVEPKFIKESAHFKN